MHGKHKKCITFMNVAYFITTVSNQWLLYLHIDLFYFIGYGKTVSHVIIGLKTTKGTKQLKLDPSIYESLQKEKVEVGDVIYIEANSGSVKVQVYFYHHRVSTLSN